MKVLIASNVCLTLKYPRHQILIQSKSLSNKVDIVPYFHLLPIFIQNIMKPIILLLKKQNIINYAYQLITSSIEIDIIPYSHLLLILLETPLDL